MKLVNNMLVLNEQVMLLEVEIINNSNSKPSVEVRRYNFNVFTPW